MNNFEIWHTYKARARLLLVKNNSARDLKTTFCQCSHWVARANTSHKLFSSRAHMQPTILNASDDRRKIQMTVQTKNKLQRKGHTMTMKFIFLQRDGLPFLICFLKFLCTLIHCTEHASSTILASKKKKKHIYSTAWSVRAARKRNHPHVCWPRILQREKLNTRWCGARLNRTKRQPKKKHGSKAKNDEKKIFSDSDRSLPPFVCRSSIALDSTRNIMNKRRKWKNCLPNPEKQRKKFWYIHVQKDNCVLQCVFVMGPPSPQGCEKKPGCDFDSAVNVESKANTGIAFSVPRLVFQEASMIY